jgi:hypothetical protein
MSPSENIRSTYRTLTILFMGASEKPSDSANKEQNLQNPLPRPPIQKVKARGIEGFKLKLDQNYGFWHKKTFLTLERKSGPCSL